MLKLLMNRDLERGEAAAIRLMHFDDEPVERVYLGIGNRYGDAGVELGHDEALELGRAIVRHYGGHVIEGDGFGDGEYVEEPGIAENLYQLPAGGVVEVKDELWEKKAPEAFRDPFVGLLWARAG